jgi:hypothetical protein
MIKVHAKHGNFCQDHFPAVYRLSPSKFLILNRAESAVHGIPMRSHMIAHNFAVELKTTRLLTAAAARFFQQLV